MYSIDTMTSLNLGEQGEHLANELRIDMSPWLEGTEGLKCYIYVLRHAETSAYIAATTMEDDNVLLWPVSSWDTAITGAGLASFVATDGTRIIRSKRIRTEVGTIIPGTDEDEIPEPMEAWRDELIAQITVIRNAAEAAQAGAETAQSNAETAQAAAEDARDKALGAQGAAETARDNARTAQNAAEAARDRAVSAETAANSARDAAQGAQAAAEAAQSAAAESAAAAKTSETNAKSSELIASVNQMSALNYSKSAKQSADKAESQASMAEVAKGLAFDKADEATASASAAAQSATNAAESASAASTSESNAAASASAAAQSASQAAGSATQAGNSATAAAGSATQAGQYATAAGQSARNAEDAAQDAHDVLDSIPDDYCPLSSDVTSLKSAIGDVENALLVTANGFVGGGERIFNVTSGTSHSAVKGFWPVQIKSGAGFTVEVKSTAITGYQLYAYYGDGTDEKIYSGTSFKNAFTASKAITSFGFYIGSTFVTSSGTVEADLVITDGFYDTTVKTSDTVDMVYGHVGETSKTWAITSGTAISGESHEVAIEINTGETFSIGVMCKPYGALTAVQYYLMYADGTNERIYSSSYSLIYRGIAKKKVSAVRLSVGATGVTATGTCTITIKKLDDTVIAREIAELNKDSAIRAINHRGYNNAAPENTIPAFILSYKAGFKYVETDIQLTSDGVPVLLHDGTINRTARTATGEELTTTINISDITYEQALTYDFGIYKGAEYAGTKIPTMREFVLLCKRLSLHPYIEIKPTGFTEAQVKGLVDLVISCGMRDNVTWISQNSAYLAYVSTYCNKCRLGLVVSTVTADNVLVAAGLKTDNNDVFVNAGSVSAEAVSLCIGQNLPLEYWTENVESTLITVDPYVSGISSDIINVVEYYTDRVLATGTAVWN